MKAAKWGNRWGVFSSLKMVDTTVCSPAKGSYTSGEGTFGGTADRSRQVRGGNQPTHRRFGPTQNYRQVIICKYSTLTSNKTRSEFTVLHLGSLRQDNTFQRNLLSNSFIECKFIVCRSNVCNLLKNLALKIESFSEC